MHSRKSAQAGTIQQSSYLFKDKTFFAGENAAKKRKNRWTHTVVLVGGCFYVVSTMRICAIERTYLIKPPEKFSNTRTGYSL